MDLKGVVLQSDMLLRGVGSIFMLVDSRFGGRLDFVHCGYTTWASGVCEDLGLCGFGVFYTCNRALALPVHSAKRLKSRPFTGPRSANRGAPDY